MLMYDRDTNVIIERIEYIPSKGKLSHEIDSILMKYHHGSFDDCDLIYKLNSSKFMITKTGKFKARMYSSDFCFQGSHSDDHYPCYVYRKYNTENIFSHKLVWSKINYANV